MYDKVGYGAVDGIRLGSEDWTGLYWARRSGLDQMDSEQRYRDINQIGHFHEFSEEHDGVYTVII